MISADTVSVISVGIAIVALVESALTRFVRSRSRSYAAQRDFERLREDFEKMRTTLEIIESDFRRLDRDIVALRTMVQLKIPPVQQLDSLG